MKRIFRIEIESTLSAPVDVLWADITRMSGVNDELFPLAKMTFPKEGDDYRFDEAPVGTTLFASVILGLTIFPIDLHHLRFERVLEGRGFEENSTSLVHRFWRHTRMLEPVGRATRLRDTVCFRPRIAMKGYLLQPVYRHVFRHRHRRLARRYHSLDA